jgi:hypothetical protein
VLPPFRNFGKGGFLLTKNEEIKDKQHVPALPNPALNSRRVLGEPPEFKRKPILSSNMSAFYERR